MKYYKIINQKKPAETYTIPADSLEDALFAWLHKMGYFIILETK